MTDHRGTFEHACHVRTTPRTWLLHRRHGSGARRRHAAARVGQRRRIVWPKSPCEFLNDAQSLAGPCRNRMDRNGRWTDAPATEDAWGRCLWGLGTAAAHSRSRWFAGWLSSSSSAPPWSVRGGRGRWRLRRWEPPNSSASDPGHRAARALITDYAAGTPRDPAVTVTGPGRSRG